MSDLPFTGERFVPGTRGEIWVEHWHRYHFAARWCVGKRVLDVACGEGYGSALLARRASSVVGVDLAEPAIAHATRAYASIANARFVQASCSELPIADSSIEVAVSFETLEHIEGQGAFVDELARVLAADGVLVLSCPNKLEYSDKRDYANEFHVRELYRDELAELVRARFPHLAWYGQRPSFFSVIAPEREGESAGQLVEVTEGAPDAPSARLQDPLYFLLVASRDAAALDRVPAALSVLSDRDEWVHRDYSRAMRDLHETHHHALALAKDLGERDLALLNLGAEAGRMQQTLVSQEAALARLEALAKAQADQHAAMLQEKDREIRKRGGFRWWLRHPLVRLGLLK